MAREAGQYRKMLLEQQEQKKSLKVSKQPEEHDAELGFSWFRIRFYISLILFVCYVLLDYTGVSIQQVTSQNILAAIQEDFTENFQADTLLAQLMGQITITEEENSHVSDTAAGH